MDKIIERNRCIIGANLRLLSQFFRAHSDFARMTPPKASSIAFPHMMKHKDSEKIIEKIIAESGVLLVPGAYYDHDPAYFRIGYGRINMLEALAKLENWMETQDN
jgi:aspartate/methionine/tyrosine aminotransferase